MTVKKIEDKKFTDLTGHFLSNISMLNLFKILEEDNEYYLNIFKSYEINLNILLNAFNYKSYDVGENEWFDQIAFNMYKNPELWWIICLTNNIINPLEEIIPGKNLKLFTDDYLPQIIREIKGYTIKK